MICIVSCVLTPRSDGWNWVIHVHEKHGYVYICVGMQSLPATISTPVLFINQAAEKN